jgi:hypothetical protein
MDALAKNYRDAISKISKLEDEIYRQKEKELELLQQMWEQEQKLKVDRTDVALKKYLAKRDLKGIFVKEAEGEYLVNGTKRVKVALEGEQIIINGKMSIEEFI